MSDCCQICDKQISFFQKKYSCQSCQKTICKSHLNQSSQTNQNLCIQCVQQTKIKEMNQDLENHQTELNSNLELSILTSSRRDREIRDLNSQLNLIKQQVDMIDSNVKENNLIFYNQMNQVQEDTNKLKDVQEMYKIELKHSQDNSKKLAQLTESLRLELID